MSKWQQWHQGYDDPQSSLSRRLEVVRRFVAQALAESSAPARLISLCSGDGRDAIPMIAESDKDVDAVLVELDPILAQCARDRATEHEISVTVRTADAGLSSSFADHAPASVFLLCGIFGNVSDADIERTIRVLPSYLTTGACVIWTRGDHEVDGKVSDVLPSERVRWGFNNAGYTELGFVSTQDAGFRVGMHRWPHPTAPQVPPDQRLFTFLW